MVEQGTVREIKGEYAIVRIIRTAACGNCQMCGMAASKKFIDLTVANTLNAKIGDAAEVQINEKSALKASLILYAIPLFAAVLLTVIAALLKLPDGVQVAAFVVGIFGGVLVGLFIDRKTAKDPRVAPVMLKIINEEKNTTLRR